MARIKKHRPNAPNTGSEEIPPGATRRAFDREDNGGGTPGSPLGDRHAQGTPAGGTAFGGLAGSNIDDGDPENADLEAALGSGLGDRDGAEDEEPYAGRSGGAVGGTPARGRATGGRTGRGIAPGSSKRGDSTIGAKPSKRRTD